ncbi:MAG: hypothetical protein ACKV2V_16065 [Blastocatellia bacterium]
MSSQNDSTYTTNPKTCPRRQAWERLPKWAWLQAFVTWVQGVPYPGQQPFFTSGPLSNALIHLMAPLLTAALTGWLALYFPAAGWAEKLIMMALMLIGVLTTSGLLRAMSMYLEHYASHRAFGPYSSVIGEIAALLSQSIPLNLYEQDHLGPHHGHAASPEDPDQNWIESLGFRPGLPVSEYRAHLLRVLAPGRYFLRNLLARIAGNLSPEQPRWRRAAFISFQMAPLVIAELSRGATSRSVAMLAVMIAWYLPLTYGAWISRVLFALGLHVWFYRPDPRKSAYENMLGKTGARFFGDVVPAAELSGSARLFAWAIWWVRLILIHMLIGKLFVMGDSDNMTHDAHHQDPAGRIHKFWIANYTRPQLIAARPRFRAWHTWGTVLTAIEHNFLYWSQAPRQEEE